MDKPTGAKTRRGSKKDTWNVVHFFDSLTCPTCKTAEFSSNLSQMICPTPVTTVENEPVILTSKSFIYHLALTAISPDGPGLAGTSMSPFWILLDLSMTEAVSGDNWSYKTCKAPVKWSSPTNEHPVFTGRMPFLSPNQQSVSKRWRKINWPILPEIIPGLAESPQAFKWSHRGLPSWATAVSAAQ